MHGEEVYTEKGPKVSSREISAFAEDVAPCHAKKMLSSRKFDAKLSCERIASLSYTTRRRKVNKREISSC